MAGLKDVRVETTTETMQFQTGKELWDWLVSSNPIAEMVLGELDLTSDERGAIRDALDPHGPRARRRQRPRRPDHPDQHRHRDEVMRCLGATVLRSDAPAGDPGVASVPVGGLHDLTGSYRAALLNGIAWNLLNMSIAFWLLLGRLRPAPAVSTGDAPGANSSSR